MVARGLFAFYQFWHGTLHLRGAGRLLSWAAQHNRSLQKFRLVIPSIGETTFDFRDSSSFYWVNYLLGDRLEEEGMNLVMRRYLKPGSTFWDVGANVGLISGLVLTEYPDVKIVSIEPNPLLASRLKLLFVAHERVTVLERGLSDINGEHSLFVPDGASLCGSFGSRGSESGKLVPVPVARGDSLLEEFPTLTPPALIKIDVEGHEPAVFRGLSGIVGEHRPVIIFEHQFLTDAVIEELIPRGYEKFSIHDETGELLPGIQRPRSHNMLLLPAQNRG
jgi:FkbM family methyltransferase